MKHRNYFFVIAVLFLCAQFFGCGKSDDELMTIAAQQAAHQQWPEAMESYRAVINAHPNGPRAAEAIYKSGMIAYSQMKNIGGSAAIFEEVAGRFASANEAPKSLMILGFIFSEEPTMRNLDSARKYYTLLRANYPADDLARGAALELAHLGESPDQILPDPQSSSKQHGNTFGDSLARSQSARALAH